MGGKIGSQKNTNGHLVLRLSFHFLIKWTIIYHKYIQGEAKETRTLVAFCPIFVFLFIFSPNVMATGIIDNLTFFLVFQIFLKRASKIFFHDFLEIEKSF